MREEIASVGCATRAFAADSMAAAVAVALLPLVGESGMLSIAPTLILPAASRSDK